jgi:O-methyltransferase involved in polyketide biosynthesis
MSSIHFIKTELAAAFARDVRQCVIVGSRPLFQEELKSSPDQNFHMFTVNEEHSSVSPSTFVRAQFASTTLALTLERSDFEKRKASLFIWLGSSGYRTVDAVMAGLAFIVSLPKGSGVVLDYAVERTSLRAHTALDALASRICSAGTVKYLIQPQAVAAMLRGLGFRQIVDLAHSVSGGHLVSAVV